MTSETEMTEKLEQFKRILTDEIVRLSTHEVVFACETEEVLFKKVKNLASAHEKLSEVIEHIDNASW